MANQGGSHEQHVKAGQQSHKTASSSHAGDDKSAKSGSTRGGDSDKHSKAGQESHKNSK